MKRGILLIILYAVCCIGAHAQDKHRNKGINENRFFEVEAAFMGPFDDRSLFGVYTSVGYELKHPKFELFGIKPYVGYYYTKYTSQRYKWVDVWGQPNRVVDEVRYKLYGNSLSLGVAVKTYFYLDSDVVESIFLSNDFSWAKQFGKVEFPEQPIQPTVTGSSNFKFYYTLKAGVKFAPESWRRIHLLVWVGGTTFKLKKLARELIPQNFGMESLTSDWMLGVSFNF